MSTEDAKYIGYFESLSSGSRSYGSFLTSLAANVAILVLIVLIGAVHHQVAVKKMQADALLFPVKPPKLMIPDVKVAAPPKAAAPPPAPKVGGFDSPKPTLVANNQTKPAPTTGGFGDPHGVAPNPNAGAVASASANSVVGGHGLQTAQAAEPAFTPPVVISKPKARYTEEARQARVQGEVTLQVRFLANGSVEVIRVVKGLGHGLDEEARHVAESIRFKPATKNGQPVDHTTLIHVTFQLA